MRRNKAFTLIELLVVISIIALLLAILMPALAKVRNSARRTICSTNMHQWSVALAAYASDNRGMFPYNGYNAPSGYKPFDQANISDPTVWVPGIDISWNSRTVQEFWAKYIVKPGKEIGTSKNNVLFCPTSMAHRQVSAGNISAALNQGLCGYFYLPSRDSTASAMNYKPAEDGGRGVLWVNKKRFGEYSRSPILVDITQSLINSPTQPNPWIGGAGPYSNHAAKNAQPEGQNYLFEDGHVTWVKWKNINPKSATEKRKVLGSTISGDGIWDCYYRIPLGAY